MKNIFGIMWSKMSDGLRSRFGGTMEGDRKKDGLDNVTNDIGLKSIGANDLVEGDLNNGISEVDEKRLKLENIDDKRVEMIDLNEEPVVQLSPNDVDEENNEGINQVDKKKLNLENVEYKSVEPNNIQNKGRRGRKRKYSQVSTSNAQRIDMIDLNQEPVLQLSGRVLRSRTVGGGANDLVDGGLNDVDEEKNEGINEVDKKKVKLENVEDRSPSPSNVLKKGRSGRKKKKSHVLNNAHRVERIDLNKEPMVQLSGRVLRSRTVGVGANDLVKGELNDMDETNEGIVEGDTETPKLENVDDKSVGADNKGRRGRKRKNSRVSTSNARRGDMSDLNDNNVIQVCGRALRSRTVDVGVNDVQGYEGIDEVDSKSILNLENVEDISVADSSIRKKRKKNHRGRSPNKVNLDSVSTQDMKIL